MKKQTWTMDEIDSAFRAVQDLPNAEQLAPWAVEEAFKRELEAIAEEPRRKSAE